MACCPYRIVFPGPDDGEVATKRDAMLTGHPIRYGVQKRKKRGLRDWWHLSATASYTKVQGDSESHWIAILLEVRQTYLRVCWMYRPSELPTEVPESKKGNTRLYKSNHSTPSDNPLTMLRIVDIIDASSVASRAVLVTEPSSYYCFKRRRIFYLIKRTSTLRRKIQGGTTHASLK
ncbi:uncharacterized protein PpBr36_11047 [Pyricularia pennisetigena]|uniref:uncharacterized protein n=1 Tax=Pyricularia pennisetigena TaxID=1578925 RepID=UPI001154BD32|nr:uncharacterized protein PpBr36_11047 [Pyricularia pennisetigena]TLS20668.1 hypothetical protein PpBr36_11047 [Pyricularia pennisetigena]